MNSAGTSLPNEQTPADTSALLQRILDAVEKDKRSRWVEITCAVVLSLATMSSAWCAYQSTLWSGVQTFRLAAANKASRKSTESALAALQFRAVDATMTISWMQAKHQGDKRQEEFLFNRFRPETKRAVEAWLKTDPLNKPDAPSSPFKMAEYVQPELEEAKRLDELAGETHSAAQKANETSDTYVLLTVLFASVLFFGGIAGTINFRRLRISILVIALTLFVITLAYLSSMPVCME